VFFNVLDTSLDSLMLSNMEFETTPSPSLNDADSTLESLVVIGVKLDI